jgi:hypothetical protein
MCVSEKVAGTNNQTVIKYVQIEIDFFKSVILPGASGSHL